MVEQSNNVANGNGRLLSRVGDTLEASFRPLPTETGDGTYVNGDTSTGLSKDIGHFELKDAKTIADVAKSAISGDPVDDKEYIMERVIQVSL